MKKVRVLAVFNLIALLIQLAVSWMVQNRMVNARDVGQVSDDHPTLFTPAGLTFAIWGLIYLLLLVFCVYHLIMTFRQPPSYPANRDLERIGGLFILNNLFTAGWLYVWTHGWLLASVALILFQLITLIAMNAKLGIYDRSATIATKACTQLPLSIYFGWITVATVACADAWLSTTGWDRLGFSAISWTIGLIGLTVCIAMIVVLGRRNVFYGLVVIWALYGIIIKRLSGPVPYPDIVLAAQIGMIVVGLACLLQLALNMSERTLHRRHDPFPLAPHSLK